MLKLVLVYYSAPLFEISKAWLKKLFVDYGTAALVTQGFERNVCEHVEMLLFLSNDIIF